MYVQVSGNLANGKQLGWRLAVFAVQQLVTSVDSSYQEFYNPQLFIPMLSNDFGKEMGFRLSKGVTS